MAWRPEASPRGLRHPFKRGGGLAFAVCLATLSSGCATLPGSTLSLAPLEAALTASPDTLEASARRGSAVAQYGLSLALQHGLNGRARDSHAASAWRARAVASRGWNRTPIYVPGVNGRAGTVIFANVPRYDLPPGQARGLDRCVQYLQAPLPPGLLRAAERACGEKASLQRLRTLWLEAAMVPLA